ncbi:MAG: hypothetical protein Q8S21_06425 [Candidatus Paracaedibacteraceae bacterium]|nr:hypothetical protein [Candidatus Paracaedibacteraceae bacterium]
MLDTAPVVCDFISGCKTPLLSLHENLCSQDDAILDEDPHITRSVRSDSSEMTVVGMSHESSFDSSWLTNPLWLETTRSRNTSSSEETLDLMTSQKNRCDSVEEELHEDDLDDESIAETASLCDSSSSDTEVGYISYSSDSDSDVSFEKNRIGRNVGRYVSFSSLKSSFFCILTEKLNLAKTGIGFKNKESFSDMFQELKVIQNLEKLKISHILIKLNGNNKDINITLLIFYIMKNFCIREHKNKTSLLAMNTALLAASNKIQHIFLCDNGCHSSDCTNLKKELEKHENKLFEPRRDKAAYSLPDSLSLMYLSIECLLEWLYLPKDNFIELGINAIFFEQKEIYQVPISSNTVCKVPVSPKNRFQGTWGDITLVPSGALSISLKCN